MVVASIILGLFIVGVFCIFMDGLYNTQKVPERVVSKPRKEDIDIILKDDDDWMD